MDDTREIIIESSEEPTIPEPLTADQLEQKYKERVISLVRDQYSSDDEFAMLRKNMAGIDTAEFTAYNTFVEGCKTQAKAELNVT